MGIKTPHQLVVIRPKHFAAISHPWIIQSKHQIKRIIVLNLLVRSCKGIEPYLVSPTTINLIIKMCSFDSIHQILFLNYVMQRVFQSLLLSRYISLGIRPPVSTHKCCINEFTRYLYGLCLIAKRLVLN